MPIPLFALLTDFSGPRPEGVAQAKQLCEELLEKVKSDYHAYKERPPPNRYGDRDGYGGGRPGYGDRGDRDRSQSYGYGGGNSYGGGYGAPNGAADIPATPVGATDPNAQAADYNAQYAQWAVYYAANPAEDPYAAYGGFAAVMAQYSQGGYGQYYGQGYTAGQTQSPAPGVGAAAPPPPPPTEPTGYGAPPPPPPPAASPGVGYGAVPPPPGL